MDVTANDKICELVLKAPAQLIFGACAGLVPTPEDIILKTAEEAKAVDARAVFDEAMRTVLKEQGLEQLEKELTTADFEHCARGIGPLLYLHNIAAGSDATVYALSFGTAPLAMVTMGKHNGMSTHVVTLDTRLMRVVAVALTTTIDKRLGRTGPDTMEAVMKAFDIYAERFAKFTPPQEGDSDAV